MVLRKQDSLRDLFFFTRGFKSFTPQKQVASIFSTALYNFMASFTDPPARATVRVFVVGSARFAHSAIKGSSPQPAVQASQP